MTDTQQAIIAQHYLFLPDFNYPVTCQAYPDGLSIVFNLQDEKIKVTASPTLNHYIVKTWELDEQGNIANLKSTVHQGVIVIDNQKIQL